MDYKHPHEDKWKQVTCGLNSTTRKSLDEAKNRLELKVAKILGELDKKKTNLTINEALDLWFEFRNGSVAEGTHTDDVENTLKFKAKFGKWQVSKIEKDHLKDFLMSLTVAPAFRKNYRSKLNLFFQFCEDEGYLDETPMLRVRLPKHKETLEEKQKREDKFFTVDEMRVLLEAMEQKANQNSNQERKQNQLRKRMFIEFQLLLGDRISESLGLRYQDIDEVNQLLHLRTQYDARSSVKNPQLKTLKTKHSERTLRLKQRELEIILWFKENNVAQTEFIFTQENGSLFGHKV